MTFRPGNESGRNRTDLHAGRVIIPHRRPSPPPSLLRDIEGRRMGQAFFGSHFDTVGPTFAFDKWDSEDVLTSNRPMRKRGFDVEENFPENKRWRHSIPTCIHC